MPAATGAARHKTAAGLKEVPFAWALAAMQARLWAAHQQQQHDAIMMAGRRTTTVAVKCSRAWQCRHNHNNQRHWAACDMYT